MSEFESNPLAKLCCICGGQVLLSGAMTQKAETSWGDFEVSFHKSCYDNRTKDDVERQLTELALQAKR